MIKKNPKLIMRTVSAILIFVMMISMYSFNTLAVDNRYGEDIELEYPTLYASTGAGEEILEDVVDTAALRKYLAEQFAGFSERINVLQFQIPATDENVDALRKFIWKDMPESFQVYGLGVGTWNGIISAVSVSYRYTQEEYTTMFAQFESAVSDMLRGIKDNDSLSDEEKALLIHDRLAVWNEYDYANYLAGSIPKESYTAYGALVLRTSVCEGYTLAYDYMLEQVGIKSAYCSSETLNHAWNIVYIDNVPYHVDVTFDDSVWDITGRVSHNNFLVSSGLFYENSHEADDYDTSPQDTRYEDYYWRNSQTAAQLVDGRLYYIDNVNSTLNSVSGGTVEELASVRDTWKAGTNSYWRGNYSRLSSDGSTLFLSLSKAVYTFNLTDNTLNKVYEPDLTAGDFFSIYGFEYDGGYLVCDLNSSPNFQADTKELYQVRYLYNPNIVLSMEILSNPDKTTYNKGDSLNTDGLRLKVAYVDGSSETITSGFTVRGFSSDSLGEKTVTVSYGGKEATFTVNVVCGHTHTTVHPAVPSTCLTQGNGEYTTCDECGEVISGSDEKLPLGEHAYTETARVQYLKTPATCHSRAVYYKSCSLCGEKGDETFEYGEFDPENHTGATYVRNQREATCFEEGYTGDVCCSDCGAVIAAGTATEKKAHNYASVWSADENYHWKECLTDGCDSVSGTSAHSGGEATCTERAVCSVCGVEYGEIDADNHKHTERRNVKAATENEAGYTGDIYCTDCGKMIQEGTTVPKLDHTHNMIAVPAKAADCTANGNIAYWHCSRCDKYYSDAQGIIEISLADTVIPAGHTLVRVPAKEPTEFSDGNIEYFRCTVCGKLFADAEALREISLEDTVIKATGDYKIGDADSDGEINSSDATLVLQHYAGIRLLAEAHSRAVDVNGDSEINASDATLILQLYAGVITKFPIEA